MKSTKPQPGDGAVTASLDFIYDESGRPFALNYSINGGRSFNTYYYVLNLQGDVVKLGRYRWLYWRYSEGKKRILCR